MSRNCSEVALAIWLVYPFRYVVPAAKRKDKGLVDRKPFALGKRRLPAAFAHHDRVDDHRRIAAYDLDPGDIPVHRHLLGAAAGMLLRNLGPGKGRTREEQGTGKEKKGKKRDFRYNMGPPSVDRQGRP